MIWQEYKATQNKINKIQSAEDLSEFRKVSEEMVDPFTEMHQMK